MALFRDACRSRPQTTKRSVNYFPVRMGARRSVTVYEREPLPPECLVRQSPARLQRLSARWLRHSHVRARLFAECSGSHGFWRTAHCQNQHPCPVLHFGTDCAAPIAELTVTLDTKSLPPFIEISAANLWSGVSVAADGTLHATPFEVAAIRSQVVNQKDDYPMNGGLVITLKKPLDEFPVRLLISLDYLNGGMMSWQPDRVPKQFRKICTVPVAFPPVASSTAFGGIGTSTRPAGRGCDYTGLGFVEPSKPGDEKVKLSGAWTTGYSTRPLYSIDATMEIPICPLPTFDIDIGGTIKTAERRSIDPDSFTAYVSLKPKTAKHIGQSRTFYHTRGIRDGGEFSRKDQFENILFVPHLTMGAATYRTNASGKLRFCYGFELVGAFEGGHNRRTKNLRSGYGAIGRLAPGLSAYFLVPMKSTARSLILSTYYNPRILLSAEPFTDNRIWVAHEAPFKSFAAGTRHYWQNQLAADLTPLVSLSVKSEFGSMPPAFNIVDFRLTTGVTLKWKWRE